MWQSRKGLPSIKIMKIALIILLMIPTLLIAELLFEITDIVGDDHGAGNVEYPEHPMFTKGLFDLTYFRVYEEDDHYTFAVGIAGKIEPVRHAEFRYRYDLPEHFILPLVHIYIDVDNIESSGFINTIRGTNLEMRPENAWEKAIVISSMPNRYRAVVQRQQPEIARRVIIPEDISISRAGDEISVDIEKSRLGEISESWGFAVLMFSHDFSDTIAKTSYIREVRSTASQYSFGGGSGGLLRRYDPNVIDMITEHPFEQKQMLSSFDTEEQKLAQISAFYPFSNQQKREQATTGEVIQFSDTRVVINLGSEHGVQKETRFIIDGHIVVVAEEIFSQLTIASYTEDEQWRMINQGAIVSILHE
jgi:carbohydrate-binding DOMON domain-containing protein